MRLDKIKAEAEACERLPVPWPRLPIPMAGQWNAAAGKKYPDAREDAKSKAPQHWIQILAWV